MNFSLRTKLTFSFMAMAAILFAVGFLGIFSVTKVKEEYQSVVHGNVGKLKLVGTLMGYAKDSVLPILQLPMVQKYPDKLADYTSDFTSATTKYSETVKLVADLEKNEEEQKIFSKVDEKWSKYLSLANQAIEKAKQAKGDAEFESLIVFVNDEVDTVRLELYEDLARLSTFQSDSANSKDEMVSADSRFLQILTLSAVFIGALFAIGFGLWFSRRISNSIKATILDLSQSSEELSQAFIQLRTASQRISSGSAESASSLEETVASIDQVAGMVKSNAESLVKASDLAKQSKDLAESGASKVGQLIESIKELSVFSGKIESIVSVIDDIAFQINLLALNAAVEAARAGEQGKGFAVVADAVRELAQKSANAAKEIGALISVSVEKTKNSAMVADTSSTSLSTILNSVTDLSVIVSEVTKAGQDQADGLGQINQAMNLLDQATQTNASSAEETSSSADALSVQSEKLNQLVAGLNAFVDGKAA